MLLVAEQERSASARLTAEAATQRTYHTLDGMRGIGAILIVLAHYKMYFASIDLGGAYVGVDLFFALSGFVLSLAYGQRLEVGFGVGRFLLLRMVRLYPIYLVGLVIGVIPVAGALLLSKAQHWTWGSLALAGGSSLLILPTPPLPGRPAALYPLNIPAWTLLFEFAVNILFAAVLRLRLKRFVPLIVAGSAPLIVVATWSYGNLDGGWLWSGWWIGLVRVVFSFFAGVLAFELHAKGRLPRLRGPAWLVIVAMIALMAYQPPVGWREAYDCLSVLVLLPLLLCIAIEIEPRSGVKLYALLGLISYPLYSIHVPCEILLLKVSERLLYGRAWPFAVLLGVVILAGLIVASWALAVSYDPFARRWLGRRLGLAVRRVP